MNEAEKAYSIGYEQGFQLGYLSPLYHGDGIFMADTPEAYKRGKQDGFAWGRRCLIAEQH